MKNKILGRLATQFDLSGSDIDFLSVTLDELWKASREEAIATAIEIAEIKKWKVGEPLVGNELDNCHKLGNATLDDLIRRLDLLRNPPTL